MPSPSSRRGAMVGVLVTATGGLLLGGVAGLVMIDDGDGPRATSATSTSSSTFGAGGSPTSTSSTSTQSTTLPPSTIATTGGATGATTSTTSTTSTTRTATGGGDEQALANTGADSSLILGIGLALAGLALAGKSLRTRASGPSGPSR